MANCSHCGAKAGFLSGNSTTTCAAEDCEEEGCNSCNRIKKCHDCGGNYCEKHFAPDKHGCSGAEEEKNDEETSEDDNESDISYCGENKEFAIMQKDEYDDVEALLVEAQKLENTGYAYCRDYSDSGTSEGCWVFRKEAKR